MRGNLFGYAVDEHLERNSLAELQRTRVHEAGALRLFLVYKHSVAALQIFYPPATLLEENPGVMPAYVLGGNTQPTVRVPADSCVLSQASDWYLHIAPGLAMKPQSGYRNFRITHDMLKIAGLSDDSLIYPRARDGIKAVFSN